MTRTPYTGTKNASSWAFRAWLALKEAEIPFEEVVVDISMPQRLANLARIARFSPPTVIRLVSHIPSLEPWPLSLAWPKVLLGRPAVKEWLAEAHVLPPVLLDGYRD